MENAVAAVESKIAAIDTAVATKEAKIEKAGQQKSEKKEKRSQTKVTSHHLAGPLQTQNTNCPMLFLQQTKVAEVAKKELQVAVTKKRAEKKVAAGRAPSKAKSSPKGKAKSRK